MFGVLFFCGFSIYLRYFFSFFGGIFVVLTCFWVKKVTQFVARLGRGAKKRFLLVLKNQ